MARSIYGGLRDTDGSARFICGTVISVSPLCVRVDPSLTLDASQLIMPGGVYKKSCTVKVNGTTYTGTVAASLAVGSRLLMIRESGGQRYAVIDVAV